MSNPAQIGIFFGSSTGTTERVARVLHGALGERVYAAYDIAQSPLSYMASFPVLLLGTSTWNNGELQDDWLLHQSTLEGMDLRGKWVGFFGIGDRLGYGETFLDAMGILYDIVVARGGTPFGATARPAGLADQLRAVRGQTLVGLGIDDNDAEADIDAQTHRWAAQLVSEMNAWQAPA